MVEVAGWSGVGKSGRMTIERALKTPGWCSEAELTYIASLASRSKVVVELGSWRGRSAVCWAENLPEDGILYAVDTFDDAAFGCESFPGDTNEMKKEKDWLWRQFLKHTQHVAHKIVPLRMTTTQGIRAVRELGYRDRGVDVVFIDAAHDARSVEEDITSATTLNPRTLCGHDYGFADWPDVKVVVDRLIPQFRVIDSLWTTEVLSD